MKSPVSGRAGSIRVQRLGGVAMAAAEAHGKRLDNAGPARAINEVPPLTTTGLDLAALYERHVDGAFVSASKTKALHVLVQFPKELLDGDDAETMLREARAWAKSVFGEAAIFADRVDRDEKSRHVVDLFIAPRYEKTTKHTTKTAVSTTVHLKALAEQYGRAPTLRGQGQALQDSWAEHLREKMNLNVSRGAQKRSAGDDWMSPEELAAQARVDHLADELKQKREEEAKVATALAERQKELAQVGALLDPLQPLLAAYRAFQTRQNDLETPQLRHLKAAAAVLAELASMRLRSLRNDRFVRFALSLAHPETPKALGIEWTDNPLTNFEIIQNLTPAKVRELDEVSKDGWQILLNNFDERFCPEIDEGSGRLRWLVELPLEMKRGLSAIVGNLAKSFRREDATTEPLPPELKPIAEMPDPHKKALDAYFQSRHLTGP